MKKIAIVMVLCLVGLLAVPAFAVTDTTMLQYAENEDGTLTITGYKGYLDTLEVPSEMDGKAVTAIGEQAFMQRETLTAVTLPESVQTIGERAFCGCIRLATVVATGVETIEAEAFADCVALRKITTGDALKTIGDGAFEYCYKLGKFTVSANLAEIGTDAFYGCEQLWFTETENESVRTWAQENRVPVGFLQTDWFSLVLVLGLTAVLAICVSVGYTIWRKKAKKSEKNA